MIFILLLLNFSLVLFIIFYLFVLILIFCVVLLTSVNLFTNMSLNSLCSKSLISISLMLVSGDLSCSFLWTILSVSSLSLTVLVFTQEIEQPPLLLLTDEPHVGDETLAQPGMRASLPLKPAWLPKLLLLFIVAPCRWGCVNTYQCPKSLRNTHMAV